MRKSAIRGGRRPCGDRWDRCLNNSGLDRLFGPPRPQGWKKRWDEENEDLLAAPTKRKFRVGHKSGFFKAFDMPVVVKACKTLHFCCVGNREEIERLLSGVRFVGKKRSQGLGLVKKIVVSDGEEDWSCWLNGLPMRAIPAGPDYIQDLLDRNKNQQFHFKLQRMGYKPPYWHPQNQTLCLSFFYRETCS